jgi:DNA end-binding protein Ku
MTVIGSEYATMARKIQATPSRRPARKRAAKPAKRAAAAVRPAPRAHRGARPTWSGSLRLALVTVPVQLFPAIRSGAHVSFHQVHKPSGKRIRYQKIVPGVGPVETDDIVKGYDLGEGQYVLFEPDEIDDLRLEAKRTIDLVQFVSQGEIDPIWFEQPCYVVPDGELADEAYGVLRDALRATRKMGLGQFIMRGREYIAAIKPCGNGLVLETLRFADEVHEAAPFFADADSVDPDPELLDLARELIGRKTAPFDPERFHDHYAEALRELIDAKAKHRKPMSIDEDAPTGGAKVIDLVEALRRSVGTAKGGRGGPRSSAGRRKVG